MEIEKEVERLLGALRSKRVMETVSFDTLQDRTIIVDKLARMGQPAVERLIKALKDEHRFVREDAAQALGKIGDARAVEPLIQALKDKESHVRQYVQMALEELRDARAVEPLIQTLKDGDSNVRSGAALALMELRDARAVEPLIRTLKDEDVNVRKNAALALGKIGDARAFEPLIQAFKDKDEYVRECVALALGEIGDPRAVAPLTQALNDKESLVRERAKEALDKIKIKVPNYEESLVRKDAKEDLQKIETVDKDVSIPVLLGQGEEEVRRVEGVKLEGRESISRGFLLLTNRRLIFNGRMEAKGTASGGLPISCEWNLGDIISCELEKPLFGKKKLIVISPESTLKTRFDGEIHQSSHDQSTEGKAGIWTLTEISQPEALKLEIVESIEKIRFLLR